MEGRRADEEEQKDGSIPHRPRTPKYILVACALGTGVAVDRSRSGVERFRHVGGGLKEDRDRRVHNTVWFGCPGSGLGCIHVRSHQTHVSPFRSCAQPMFHYLSFPSFNMPRRIEKAIHSQSSTAVALEFIRTLQAGAPAQDQKVATWLKAQSTAVLSSIKQAPNAYDVRMFVDIAESEGLLFFSNTCVLADGRNI